MEGFTGKVLGIDIGSVAMSAVTLNHDGKPYQSSYIYHDGNPAEKLTELLSGIDTNGINSIVTPSDTPLLSETIRRIDTQTSVIRGAGLYYNNIRAILSVGASRFQLLHFDESGKFIYSATNTSCAAGTGSFLDQQAGRLNLSDAAELCRLANKNRDKLPEIASRCSVFAKTDLIHAQQAGYSLASICDSLCRGLARNIADTLFDEALPPPVVNFAGGVSRNSAVKRHLESFVKTSFDVNENSHLFAATGAAVIEYERLMEESQAEGDLRFARSCMINPARLLSEKETEKEYVFDPLTLSLSDYPDFESYSSYIFHPSVSGHPSSVQVDLYYDCKGAEVKGYMGIDIGSTSTKAIITDSDNRPYAGLYTYTSGQPLNATRSLFEAILNVEQREKCTIRIRGAGTTGSGRKFIGAVIGADQVLDEITTHARAAYELNSETDTIIEIGGQDAKFTMMRKGMVTFSRMNSVCAAGTGSFIEEQARRLGVSLADYSGMAENAPAPLASDRCTVFMERDINSYFSRRYSRSEILAAVLHSVRDNYLKKVAMESGIGDKVCFQGATAKNKALVAAFETKLGKHIYVSKYCHLTGALGTALMTGEEMKGNSSFRGFDIIDEEIELRNETCDLCNNRCRITIARVKGEDVAYGFLCGRDYNSRKFVDKNISGFDLLKERKKVSRIKQPTMQESPIIGLPAAVHMFDDLGFWTHFFNKLGYNVVTSEKLENPLSSGKRLAGAEFCAPMHAMYGHVNWLAERCDYIFFPASLENRAAGDPFYENYCYYTQFCPPLASLISDRIKERIITPLLYYDRGINSVYEQLAESLGKIRGSNHSASDIKKAFKIATVGSEKEREGYIKLFNDNFNPDEELSVLILGRPYLAIQGSMNKGIPGIFGSMGIRCFYQDMVPAGEYATPELDELLKSMPWHYAVKILQSAAGVINTRGLYPVLVTGFKCAPDSFVIEYFQKLMDSSDRPYLILQIDEHDSNVGYETRIEAAIRSFRNHYELEENPGAGVKLPVSFPSRSLSKRKIILYPNWDQLGGPLLAANLRRFGYDARLIDHTELGIQKGMSSNTGQCLPLNIIAQDCIEYIGKEGLNPSETALWMTETRLTCNIRMYPQLIKTILDNHGKGMEQVEVYSGEVAHNELSVAVTYYTYFAYMFSGLLRRVGCRIRPYEVNQGETAEAMAYAEAIFLETFEGKRKLEDSLKKALEPFHDIRRHNGERKPLVAIFGDFFVRDNDIMNQGLIHDIENYGGEVHTTPYNEFYNMAFENVMRRRRVKDGALAVMGLRGLTLGLNLIHDRFYRHFEPFLGKQPPALSPLRNEKNLEKFGIDRYHSGESYDNLLKIFYIASRYPETSLFVQTNPAFCCPSLITEAMKSAIRKETGIPIVTITYDGTTERKNDILAPYLYSLR